MLRGRCSGCVGTWYSGAMRAKSTGRSCWYRRWPSRASGLIMIVATHTAAKPANNAPPWPGRRQRFTRVANSGSSETSANTMKPAM